MPELDPHEGRKPGACVHHPDTQYWQHGLLFCGGCGGVWNAAAKSWEHRDGSADYVGGVNPVHIASERQGAACQCVFHPDSGGVTPEQRVTLSAFSLATYGVRMTHGDGLPLVQYAAMVVQRFQEAMKVILETVDHMHSPEEECTETCPRFIKPPVWRT